MLGKTSVFAFAISAFCLTAPAHAQASPIADQAFHPCQDSADGPALPGSLCAMARVPLHPAGSSVDDGEAIDLFLRKFPVTDPAQRRGEVWLVAGGPGESGASFYPLLDSYRKAFAGYDLVVPDHRGTGYSTKLCPEQEAPDSPDGMALAGKEWGPCIGTLFAKAERTKAFTVTNAAHDLATLIGRYRQPGQVYLYGVSYGTQLVLRTMLVAPPVLDGIVLDGLVPPETDTGHDLSHRTQVVDAVGRAVLTPAQIARYRALLAEPSPAWKGEVPGGNLRLLLGSFLNYPDLRDRIPAIIAALAEDDVQPLKDAAAKLAEHGALFQHYPQSPSSIPLVILVSGSENNARSDLTRETVAAEAKDALFVSTLPGLLARSPGPRYRRDGYFGQDPKNLPPTLIVHGTLDPNTPYAGASDHAAALVEAGDPVQFVTVEGAGHFMPLVAPGCFVASVSRFVAGEPAAATCNAEALAKSVE